MKKIIALFIIFLIIISMFGCARNIEDDKTSGGNQIENVLKEEEVDDKDDKKGENNTVEDFSNSIDLSNANTNLINEDKIPDEYPVDLVPFPEGA